MSSILNNLSAMGASRRLTHVGTGLARSIQRLTTGKRINMASDDAAGLAIANKLGFDFKIAGQAQRNTNDGASYLQVADGALEKVGDLLVRASQLAQQAQTGTISHSNRANLDAEFQNILTTIINVGQNTRFNGQSVFSTTGGIQTLAVEAGDYATLSIDLGSISSSATSALGLSTLGGATTTTGTTTTSMGAAALAATMPTLFTSAQGGNADFAYEAATRAGYELVANEPAGAAMTQIHLDTDALGSNLYANPGPFPGLMATLLADVNAYVAANPHDLVALAAQAAIQYQATNVPPVIGADPANDANNVGAVNAAQNAGYTTTTTTTTYASGTSLLTSGAAASAATLISAALASVSTMRASIGASEAQLSATSSILGVQVQNLTAAESQIMDADIADEMVNLTKFQILSQSGTSALAKSNQAAQQILALMQ